MMPRISKNKLVFSAVIAWFLCSFTLLSSSCNKSDFAESTNANNSGPYYFNSITGDDSNDGSIESPWKSLTKLQGLELYPGDKIFLSANSIFNEPLLLENIKGTEQKKIVISSYSNDSNKQNNKATIATKNVLNAISIVDCSFIEIRNLKVSAGPGTNHVPTEKNEMRCGILVKPKKNGTTGNLVFDNLMISDVFYEKQGFTRPKKEVNSPNGTQNYGWGIRVINSNENAIIQNIQITNCEVKNVAHTGIKFTGKNRTIKNILVENCEVFETGGPGIQMSGVEQGHVVNNNVDKSGSNNDSRKWGRGSGLWTWGSSDILIEKNSFTNANGPGDSAGVHIDFNCNDVVVQYNLSANNAGGFCEILGNNYNCAYRYNISVNDGHRVKGIDGAFQEGKTFWLSGFAGKNNKRNGPFNSYFYNNTIYTNQNIVSKYAVDKASSGVLVMNNIFYIEGESELVLGDQYTPETEGVSEVKNIIFDNNLYLKDSNWPEAVLIQDASPLIGNPNFENPGNLNLTDYTPKNIEIIKNKGLEIPKIPNDEIGLKIGLKATHDILGNSIIGLPDMGAIEINN